MSESDSLFQAILANPDDDAPRLVYADWLDEHGRPERAEFIRVQCAMARLPAQTARWLPLNDRAQRLEREWRVKWTGPVQDRALEAQLRRGFVDGVRLTVDQFRHSAEELVKLEPIRVWTFSEVALFFGGRSFTKLAADSSLLAVRALDTGRYQADELVRTLATSRYLSNLRTLIVPNRIPTSEAIRELFAAAPRLDELEMSDAIGPGVSDLWRRGAPARLRKLSLVKSHITDQTATQLASSAALVLLEVLRLDGNDITDRGAATLAGTEHLTGLRELSLAGNPIGDNGARAIARSRALRGLRLLNLSDCQIDSAGARALADSPHLDQLECLCLDDNRVSDGVEADLVKRFSHDVCSFSWTP
jgi:uncharacterized protein (TIGR02996 family)